MACKFGFWALVVFVLSAAVGDGVAAINGGVISEAGEWTRPSFCGDHECPPFKLLHDEEAFQIRTYDAADWAVAPVEFKGGPIRSLFKSMRLLRKYFNGSNADEAEMDVTVPFSTVVTFAGPRPKIQDCGVVHALAGALHDGNSELDLDHRDARMHGHRHRHHQEVARKFMDNAESDSEDENEEGPAFAAHGIVDRFFGAVRGWFRPGPPPPRPGPPELRLGLYIPQKYQGKAPAPLKKSPVSIKHLPKYSLAVRGFHGPALPFRVHRELHKLFRALHKFPSDLKIHHKTFIVAAFGPQKDGELYHEVAVIVDIQREAVLAQA